MVRPTSNVSKHLYDALSGLVCSLYTVDDPTLSQLPADMGPDLQNILRHSYDYLTIMPTLRSTYDGRLIYKTSYEGRKAFLWYDSLAKL